VSEPLHVEVSKLAAEQIRAAEAWWRLNRTKAPNAIREELERISGLLAVQPHIGTRASNLPLAGVRRMHLARVRYDIYYRVTEEPKQTRGGGVLAFKPRKQSSNLRRPLNTACSRRRPARSAAAAERDR
jgi:hypothetical protein